MALKNIVAALALLAFGVAYGVMAMLLPARDIPNIPGPSFFPVLIAAILVALSGALLWQGVHAMRAATTRVELNGVDRKAATMLGVFAVYLLALPLAGFVVAGIPFAAMLVRLYGGRNRLLVVAVAIGLPVVLFVLFREGFSILLPTGAYALFGG